MKVDRGEGQHGGIWWDEGGDRRWIFPYFRGWQSDNLIVRDEFVGIDVMTFEHTTTGEFTGGVTPGEQVEVSTCRSARRQSLSRGQVSFSVKQVHR